ncbi:phosphate transport system regulatory protein PhoU [Halobacteriales archaeon SW_12_69_24]|nr:MAG: phosphate transport system regulatory protein PhoU [Halobacteriales archaeon SW_12_69_24]
MARKTYQKELETLRVEVLAMGEMAVSNYDDALRTLDTKDDDLAADIAAADEAINDRYLALESDCIDLFALQQPVAGDLRFVASSFKILTDLERVGDLATNVADYALDAARERYPEVDIRHIGERAREMLTEALSAYADGDAEAARRIAARDDEVDRLCETATETVFESLLRTEYGDATEAILADARRLLLTVRDLERIADHAVNICARVVYMVEHDDELIY